MSITVNGQLIPEAAVQYELNRLVKFYAEHMAAEEIRRQMGALRAKARDQAIGAKLLIAEAARLDIRVPSDSIEEKYRQMVQNAGGQEAFQSMLKKQGLSDAGVRQGIERGRRVDVLIERITQGLSDPTEQEMKAHFDSHASEYRRPDRAQAQHILIQFDAKNAQERQVAESKLMEIRARISDGASFGDMAAAHSDCPSGKKTGGSLGWFSRGMMVEEFDKAVFSMEVGALSEIVETPLGLHLIHKTGGEAGGPAEFEDVREQIREFLRHVRRGEALAAYVEDLKKKAVIEIDGE